MHSLLWSSTSTSRNCRSLLRPDGSPIMPVAPPTSAIGSVPGELEPTEEHDGLQVADVEGFGGRIEPAVQGHRSVVEALGERGDVGAVLSQAAIGQFGDQLGAAGHGDTFRRGWATDRNA